jgi:hypothetical protein
LMGVHLFTQLAQINLVLIGKVCAIGILSETL